MHVKDVVVIYLKLLTSNFQGVVKVGTGKGMTVQQVIKRAEMIFDGKLRIIKTTGNENEKSFGCISKLMKHIRPHDFRSVDKYYQEIFEQITND